MNFLAHAAVARRIDDDPRFVLGAVLPDLLPMAGLSPRAVHGSGEGLMTGATTRGWALHHRVDEVFHALPAFHAGVQALRVDLRATALDRGPRRAVAHVGWELLLDDALAADLDAVSSLQAALAIAPAVSDAAPWRTLVARLASIEAHGPSTARAIAERVHRAVGRRQRLAFPSMQLDDVAAVLARNRDAITTGASDVLDAVTLASR